MSEPSGAPLNANVLMHLIRIFLRDNPKLNALLKKEETDDTMLKLAINMAISDWNTTPPMIAPVGLSNFPCVDWLIIASSMFVLQSAGVLHYRNDLQYNDNGTAVNPWSKGPQYTSLAGMWSQMVQEKKISYKVAMNYANTFGIVKSPEYRMWDYSGLYAGALFNDFGTGTSSAAPGIDSMGNPIPPGTVTPQPQPSQPTPLPQPQAPTKTPPFKFTLSDWGHNPAADRYEILFPHNLNTDVDVRITDPVTGEDYRSRCSIRFVNRNLVTLGVPVNPDQRFEGQVIAFAI